MNTSVARPIEKTDGCVKAASDILGQKWTALILRDLATCPQRFCGLEKSVGNINPRTLTQRLEQLEKSGIVKKQVAASRSEYTLTAKGQALIPVLEAMAKWGEKYTC